MKVRVCSALICALLSSGLIADTSSPVASYLAGKKSAYEKKLDICDERKKQRSSPSERILSQLEGYEEQTLREFLISKAELSRQQCFQPEIGELSYAVGIVLHDPDVAEQYRQKAQKINELIHHRNWAFHRVYNRLPDDLKTLGEEEYFQTPFSGFDVLEELGIP